MPALVPHPPIEFDAGGAPLSTLYGDVFRSRSGAWAEAREVFVEGCELARRWGERTGRPASFTVLELGFGLGVNFLATLQAWRESAPPGLRLHYVSIEAHPLSAADLRHALGVRRRGLRLRRSGRGMEATGARRKIRIYPSRPCRACGAPDCPQSRRTTTWTPRRTGQPEPKPEPRNRIARSRC